MYILLSVDYNTEKRPKVQNARYLNNGESP